MKARLFFWNEKQSFSENVKAHLRDMPIKKKCCRRAFEDGCGIYSGDSAPDCLINKGALGIVCRECLSHFIAGLFMAAGNISDPHKCYHLEYSFSGEAEAEAACQVLCRAGFSPGRGVRKGRYILYFKNSSQIEDLLGYMGASFGAFEIMNAKIVKELRENTNRQVNCDSANISKSISAAERQIKIIEKLKDSGSFNALTGDLKETANLRLNYPDASLAEIGQKFTPPISKSGVKHRLDKILDFYESEKRGRR